MSFCDYDPPEFFSQRISIARKSHECCECWKPIHKGMRYWYCAGKWDGDMGHFRQHIECRDACYTFQEEEHGDCVPFGGLREEIRERWGQTWAHCYHTKRHWRRDDKDEHERRCRSLFAAGMRASRLKPDQIAAYNEKHKDRTA